MIKSFEQVSVLSERVTKSFERVGVSSKQVTKSFERMQIFFERFTNGCKRNPAQKWKVVRVRFPVHGHIFERGNGNIVIEGLPMRARAIVD